MEAIESLKDQEDVSLSTENQLGATRAPAKQAKLSDFVLDSIEEVNMINEIRGKCTFTHYRDNSLLKNMVLAHSEKVPSFKGASVWQSAEVEGKSSIQIKSRYPCFYR